MVNLVNHSFTHNEHVEVSWLIPGTQICQIQGACLFPQTEVLTTSGTARSAISISVNLGLEEALYGMVSMKVLVHEIEISDVLQRTVQKLSFQPGPKKPQCIVDTLNIQLCHRNSRSASFQNPLGT